MRDARVWRGAMDLYRVKEFRLGLWDRAEGEIVYCKSLMVMKSFLARHVHGKMDDAIWVRLWSGQWKAAKDVCGVAVILFTRYRPKCEPLPDGRTSVRGKGGTRVMVI